MIALLLIMVAISCAQLWQLFVRPFPVAVDRTLDIAFVVVTTVRIAIAPAPVFDVLMLWAYLLVVVRGERHRAASQQGMYCLEWAARLCKQYPATGADVILARVEREKESA